MRPDLRPGQEWVWDYPRPPRLERTRKPVRVLFAGVEIARSDAALRVLETSHPPTIYIPRSDVRMEFLEPASGASLCEWKGYASYFSIRIDNRFSENAAWTYEEPSPTFRALAQHVAFYPWRVDECYVGDHRVDSQRGGFYGGWITPDVVGPFKGGPGSGGW